MWKNSHVVMLPTNQAQNEDNNTIYLNNFSKELILGWRNARSTNQTVQHLYITSDEEIKNNDWFYDTRDRIVSSNSLAQTLFSKKIIATTDNSLEYIKHETYPNGNTTGIRNLIELPQLSKEFIKIYIEEYNKGNVITKVIVEYEVMHISTMTSDVKTYPNLNIETLKLNPDNTINIKPIKDSWNREEHIANIKAFAKEFVANTNTAYKQADIDKWIENNL